MSADASPPTAAKMIILVIGGMILTQLIQDRFQLSPKKQAPGLTRGDLVLNEETLPAELDGWTKTRFLPALAPEELPEGQWWWTHAWHFQQNAVAAIVAFDQADWADWHELTVCYKATGWELKKRIIYDTSDNESHNWRYVVAEFEKDTFERGILIFSEFYDDGSPTRPREFELFAARPEVRLEERFQNRFTHTELTAAEALDTIVHHERAVQCQVFVPYQQDLTIEMTESIILLHLESRTRFRNAWIANKINVNVPATH